MQVGSMRLNNAPWWRTLMKGEASTWISSMQDPQHTIALQSHTTGRQASKHGLSSRSDLTAAPH